MTPQRIYLVEDRTRGARTSPNHSDTPHWAHVYLSLEKARAGVEFWAERGEVAGPLNWKDEGFGVQTAYPTGGGDWLYKVVPHMVRQDHEPED